MGNAIQVSQLINGRQAAKLLGVSHQTIYNKLYSGELPALRVGRLFKIDPADVLKLLAPFQPGDRG